MRLIRLFPAFGSWLPPAATEQPFMAAQALTPCDAQGSCSPLAPKQGQVPAPVVNRFFYRFTPSSDEARIFIALVAYVMGPLPLVAEIFFIFYFRWSRKCGSATEQKRL